MKASLNPKTNKCRAKAYTISCIDEELKEIEEEEMNQKAGKEKNVPSAA